MSIRNVVFDVGGVLLEWNPSAVIANLYPEPATQAVIRRQMFEHADWQEFDRGGLSYAAAIEHFAKATGRSTDETRTLIHATRESLRPMEDSVRIVEQLAAAGVHLYLLSNMPVSTFEYLIQKHGFFRHFKHLVISGAILMVKPEPAIYKHLVEKTDIVPAESVFIDDLLKNVIAARECGFHAIQFIDSQDCRAQLRTYLPGISL
ncbi:MAG: HAD family phosphatase [Pseudomonadota bacterium]